MGRGVPGLGTVKPPPWGNLTIADKMARADLLLRGGQSTKNASDTAAGAGGRSTAPAGVAHTGQGGLRGRETALPPAGGGVAPALGQHHPRGTRSCDKRRPEHSVGGAAGWRASRALTHTRRATASPDRGDARAGEVPEGVRGAPSGGRPAAVTQHAALSRPERDRQPAAATRGDSSRALPGSCCSILRARWAAGTPHMPPRPGTTGTQRQHATWAAALLGTAAVTQQASPRRGGWRPRPIDRERARPVDRSRARSKVGERRGSVRTPTTAHSAKPTSAPDLTGHAVT